MHVSASVLSYMSRCVCCLCVELCEPLFVDASASVKSYEHFSFFSESFCSRVVCHTKSVHLLCACAPLVCP